jgi:hypothetical protein
MPRRDHDILDEIKHLIQQLYGQSIEGCVLSARGGWPIGLRMNKPKIVPFAKGAPPRPDGKPSFFQRVREILHIVRADRTPLRKDVAPNGTPPSGNNERPLR